MPKTKSQKAADQAFIDKISSITIGPKSSGTSFTTVMQCPLCGKNYQAKVHAKLVGLGALTPDGFNTFMPAPGYIGPALLRPEPACSREEIALSA